MKNINISGAENLGRIQLFNLGRISNNYYEKIERSLNGDFQLNINVKCHEKAGTGDKEKSKKKPRKFGVHLQLKIAKKGLESNASDWDLNKTLHSAFDKLLSEIEHKFRVSEQKR